MITVKYDKIILATFFALFFTVSATALDLDVSPSNNLEIGETALVEVTADESRSSIWIERWSPERNEWIADKMETDCDNGCSLTYSYLKNSPGSIEVRGDGAGTDATAQTEITWSDSTSEPPEEPASVETVDISPEGEKNIDLGESVRVDVNAEGSNLESIWIERWSDSRNEWVAERQNSAGCSGSSCEVSYSFEESSETSVSVRGRAVARNSENSDIGTSSETSIKWRKEAPPQPEGPTADIHVSDTSPLVGQTISFDAFDSDPGDFPIKEYRWDLPNGNTVFDRSISAQFDSPGQRRVSLKVTDTEGLTDTDTVTLDVEESETGLRVTVRDRDDDELENARVRVRNSYEKNAVTGSNGEVRFRDLEEGDHSIRVKCGGETETRTKFVEEGTTASAKVKIDSSISDDYCDEEPDILNAQISVSDSDPFVGESVRFDASGSQGDIKEYEWEFGEGSVRYGSSIFRSFSSEGTEQVWLTVTDTEGNSDTDSASINVRERSQCKVHIGDISFRDLDATDNEAEADIRISNRGEPQDVNVRLFVNNDNVKDIDATIGTGGERRFSTNLTDRRGTDVRAEVRTSGDPCGSGFFERSATIQDTVSRDREPTARLDIDPRNADVGEEIDFDAGESSDPDGEIEEYEFDLDGDGDYEISTDESEVEETYFEELEETARVRVTDNDGNTDTASGTYTVRAKSRVSFSNVEIPQNVCSGESFDVTFTARNIGDEERVLIVEGEGFGDRNSYSTHLEEDEEDEVTITFTTGEPGTGEFTIRSVGGNSDTVENTVEVLDCETAGGEIEGISMKVVPDRVRAGESVRISGYVDNARGRQDVEIEMDGRNLKTVSTEPDGYYSTYIYPERTGDFELTAKTDRFRATRSLTVLPTVSVGNIDIPETVFHGDEIEVCAEVNSQNIPSVLLRVNGEIVESTNDRGNVCFETTAKKKGDITYEVVGLARGQSSSSSREVQVHEAKPEASSFPGQVASVESGRGIVKTTIYNNNDRRTEYFVNINGLPSTWTSTTEKQVILQPGEEREVFFYLTPREEGDYDPLVTVTSETEIVHSERVDVEVGGTSKSRNLSLFERLRNAFL